MDQATIKLLLAKTGIELALVLNHVTGWPIYGDFDPVGGLWHAWVIRPTGEAVDAYGVNGNARAQRNRAPNAYVCQPRLTTQAIDPSEVKVFSAHSMQAAQEAFWDDPAYFGLGFKLGQ